MECMTCGKCFISAGNLSTHTAYHVGDKRFKCNFCGERVYSINTITNTRANTHGRKRFSMSRMSEGFQVSCQLDLPQTEP